MDTNEFDAAIDDASSWATPKKVPKSEKRQRGVVVSVRMTPEEFEVASERAASAGKSVSSYLRALAVENPERSEPGALASAFCGVSYLGPRLDTGLSTARFDGENFLAVKGGYFQKAAAQAAG